MAAGMLFLHGRNIVRRFSKFMTTTSKPAKYRADVPRCKSYKRSAASENANCVGNEEGEPSLPSMPARAAPTEPGVEEEDVAEHFRNLDESMPQEAENVMKYWTRTTIRGGTSKVFATPSKRKSQVLGFTTPILKEKLEFLKTIGIEGKDALVIAIDFPCFLNWESPEFRDMMQILKSLGCNITKHVAKNPLVFSLSLDRSLDNVQKLQGAGVPDTVIGRLVDHNPIILAYPFSDYALKMIRFMTHGGEIDERLRTNRTYLSLEDFLIRLLMQPLDKPGKQVVFHDNFSGVVQFLKELQVSPRFLILSYPEFFNTNLEVLEAALQFFMGKPLLFETELVQRLIVVRPEIFVNFDLEQASRCVNLAASILKNPLKLYWLLQKCFFFEEGGTQLETNISMFRDHGFEDKHIAQILTYKHFFAPKGSDLKERMEFLLSNEEITAPRIAEYPLCLLLSLNNLRRRVAFVRSKNPEALKGTEMKKIFDVKDVRNMVIKICGSSMEDYKKFTILNGSKMRDTELDTANDI